MTTKRTIEDLYYAVFTTNGDPAIIENDETAEEVLSILDRCMIEEVTDAEEFAIACSKLDFSEMVPPRHIYRFTNPQDVSESGCICFPEEYGD